MDLLDRLGDVRKRELRPLWSLVAKVSTKNVGMVEKNLLSLSYGNIVRKGIGELGGLRPKSYETYNVVEAGDSVLRMTDMQNDQRSIRTGYVRERGIITSAYVTVRPSPGVVEPRYLAAVLRAYDVKKVYYEMGAGVRQTLKFEELAQLPVPVPDIPKQRRIVDYLDQEAAGIDAMDAELDRLVNVLRERRATVIERALQPYPRIALQFGWKVTDCLHRTARLVRHGTNYLVSIGQLDGQQVDVSNAPSTTSADFELLRSGGRVPRPGDAVMSRNASVGKLAVVTDETPPFALGQDVVLLSPQREESAALLSYCMESRTNQAALELAMIGTTFKRINVAAIKTLPWVQVGTDEQRRIVADLDEQAAQMDEMISDAVRLKGLLAERRSTLITDVVTGMEGVPA